MSRLAPGELVERYEVLSLLGEGSQSAVYRVRHMGLGSEHALKVVGLGSRAARRRLLREGQTQAKLHHANLVSVTDIVEVDGDPGLVMELVDGPTLRTWRHEHAPSQPEMLEVFKAIVRGVRHAHVHGLVHRDLSPGNVMIVNTDDDGAVPKVLDFGMVRAIEDDRKASDTVVGVAVGTPGFAAPEQIRGDSEIDLRADLFGLGALLYFLLCGVAPFGGDDVLEVFNATLQGDYVPLSTRGVRTSPAVKRLLVRLLSTDKERRPVSCDEVLEALGATVRVAPPQLLSSATKPAVVVPTVELGPGEARLLGLAESEPRRVGLVLAVGAVIVVLGTVFTSGLGMVGVMLTAMGSWVEPPHQAAPLSIPVEEPARVRRVPRPPPAAAVPERKVEPVVAPAPTPSEVPERVQAPVVQPTGRVQMIGDSTSVFALRGGERVALPANLTSGLWRLEADFGSGLVAAGQLVVASGRSYRLACSALVQRCRQAEPDASASASE